MAKKKKERTETLVAELISIRPESLVFRRLGRTNCVACVKTYSLTEDNGLFSR